jgi:hypothetical protein
MNGKLNNIEHMVSKNSNKTICSHIPCSKLRGGYMSFTLAYI